MHYHAILKDVVIMNNIAYGKIFNDSKQRFVDGTEVRTSTIGDIVEVNGKSYIQTRNTTYLMSE